jgi:hypothetical protein
MTQGARLETWKGKAMDNKLMLVTIGNVGGLNDPDWHIWPFLTLHHEA